MNKKKKSKLPVIIFVVLFVAGLSLMLYPTVSNWINRNHQSHAIAEYSSAVEGMSEEERSAIRAAAVAYNEKLYRMHRGAPISETELQAEYPTLLNVFGDGMMGILEIPKIKVRLAIFHGTEESVLQDSVGHVDTSSLPVGGENTHCVLSGHTGLPSARLLTDLEQMEVGDSFTLEVLGVRMTYEVDQILVVLPWKAEALAIADGKDYCTLITCTPYGVNSHRLLVRGVRSGTGYAAQTNQTPATDSRTEAADTPNTELAWWLRDELLPVYVAGGAVVLLVILLLLTGHSQKKKRRAKQAAQAASAEKSAEADEENPAEQPGSAEADEGNPAEQPEPAEADEENPAEQPESADAAEEEPGTHPES